MIKPEQIRAKAERLYPSFLNAWLAGETQYFPRTLPSNKQPTRESLAQAAAEVQRLRDNSRETLGYGYTIKWTARKSRKFGLNQFPTEIVFETDDDFLRYINRRAEFHRFKQAVVEIRAEFPALDNWIKANPRLLISVAGEINGLLHVVRYLQSNPRPGVFARELPIPVDTKFIERHEDILRAWLDIILPPHTINAGESHFARRYGLRYAEHHWLVRFLDRKLTEIAGFPYSEFSIPLSTLGTLPLSHVNAFIVENKVNLLTLPPVDAGIALGGVGRAATELREVDWLRTSEITYWGDIDVEGLHILSAWRVIFPQTRSMFMDITSLEQFKLLTGPGTGAKLDVPPHLDPPEQAAFVKCREKNIRLEQERIPQNHVISTMGINSR